MCFEIANINKAMSKTYRDIFKWGDKRETKIDQGTLNVLIDKFKYLESGLKQRHF